MSLFSFKEIGVKSESKEAENYSAFTSKLLNIQTAKIEKLSTDLLRLPTERCFTQYGITEEQN